MCKIVHEEITTNHWWDPFNWLIKSIPYLFFLFFIPILLSLINHIHFFRDDHFWFGLIFLDKNRFKPVWLGFGPVWLGFFQFFGFGFGLVRFFGFRVIKPKPNQSVFSKF